MAWNLDEAAQYYKKQGAPADQNALIAFLLEAKQENSGSIPQHLMADMARALDTKESLLLAIIRRVPRLRLSQQHVLELCAGPNCSARARLADFVDKTYGHGAENLTIKYVPCMRMCGKGPNVRFDGVLYHDANEALIQKLIGK